MRLLHVLIADRCTDSTIRKKVCSHVKKHLSTVLHTNTAVCAVMSKNMKFRQQRLLYLLMDVNNILLVFYGGLLFLWHKS